MDVYSCNYGENRSNWKGFIIFPKFLMDFCLCECLYRSKIKGVTPTIFTDFHGGSFGLPLSRSYEYSYSTEFLPRQRTFQRILNSKLALENFAQNYHATEDLKQFSYYVRFLYKGLLLSYRLALNYASTVMNDIESRLKT